MQRLLFDYVYEDSSHLVVNELPSSSVDEAINFISEHFMELHAEGESEIAELRLRSTGGDMILAYKTHFDAVLEHESRSYLANMSNGSPHSEQTASSGAGA